MDNPIAASLYPSFADDISEAMKTLSTKSSKKSSGHKNRSPGKNKEKRIHNRRNINQVIVADKTNTPLDCTKNEPESSQSECSDKSSYTKDLLIDKCYNDPVISFNKELVSNKSNNELVPDNCENELVTNNCNKVVTNKCNNVVRIKERKEILKNCNNELVNSNKELKTYIKKGIIKIQKETSDCNSVKVDNAEDLNGIVFPFNSLNGFIKHCRENPNSIYERRPVQIN